MKRGIRYIYMACVAAGCLVITGCHKDREAEEPFYPDVPMSLQMYSRASADAGTGSSARLLFWEEDDLDKVADGGVNPYYDCILEGNINDYTEEGTAFRTEQYYPRLNQRVYALGFAPDNLKQVKEGNYGNFLLPGRNGEDSTVLASNSIVGSSVYKFHEPLEFRPATTRFIFRAIRTKNMYNNLFVRNIGITIPPTLIPNVLGWDEKNRCYKAKHDEGIASNAQGEIIGNPIRYTGNQLSTTEYTALGVRYLVLPENTKSLNGITVTAELSHEIDFPTDKTLDRTWPANGEAELKIPLKDLDGNDITKVEPGESYLVTITFDRDNFILVAEKQDWEWGGKIPIPVIVPKESE